MKKQKKIIASKDAMSGLARLSASELGSYLKQLDLQSSEQVNILKVALTQPHILVSFKTYGLRETALEILEQLDISIPAQRQAFRAILTAPYAVNHLQNDADPALQVRIGALQVRLKGTDSLPQITTP